GLRVVIEGVDPAVDIVAVHGLNCHREKTWTAANGIHWLRDLLPYDIPNARILSWGYDPNTHGNSRVSCQYLYDHGISLVTDLYWERNLSNALIHSDAARNGVPEEYRSIKLSTYGILFMGTPSQVGSRVQQLGKILMNIASLFIAADDRIVKRLEQDSEWLQEQLGQYEPISRDFVTKSAFEEHPTLTVLGQSIMVCRLSLKVNQFADDIGGTASFSHWHWSSQRRNVRHPSRSHQYGKIRVWGG
ncbi:hypothetical protein BJ875DRAFT_386555, partial [Amylocarpus encephaloides]